MNTNHVWSRSLVWLKQLKVCGLLLSVSRCFKAALVSSLTWLRSIFISVLVILQRSGEHQTAESLSEAEPSIRFVFLWGVLLNAPTLTPGSSFTQAYNHFSEDICLSSSSPSFCSSQFSFTHCFFCSVFSHSARFSIFLSLPVSCWLILVFTLTLTLLTFLHTLLISFVRCFSPSLVLCLLPCCGGLTQMSRCSLCHSPDDLSTH